MAEGESTRLAEIVDDWSKPSRTNTRLENVAKQDIDWLVAELTEARAENTVLKNAMRALREAGEGRD